MHMDLVVPVFVFVFGLVVGSFLNVCISRLPENLSIIKPRSRCPRCLVPIKYYDNIPVVSFLLLRGRCRACYFQIHWRYPVVELLAGLLTLLLFLKWHGQPLWMAASLAAAYMLIAAAVMDFETMLISDIFSCGLAAVGLAACFVNPYFSGPPLSRILSAVSGAVAGAAIIWFMSLLGRKIYRKEAVGEGDILLMAGIGAMTGWEGAVSALIMSSFFGSIYGISMMLAKKARRFDSIPFGPFLAIGALINLYHLVRIQDFLFY